MDDVERSRHGSYHWIDVPRALERYSQWVNCSDDSFRFLTSGSVYKRSTYIGGDRVSWGAVYAAWDYWRHLISDLLYSLFCFRIWFYYFENTGRDQRVVVKTLERKSRATLRTLRHHHSPSSLVHNFEWLIWLLKMLNLFWISWMFIDPSRMSKAEKVIAAIYPDLIEVLPISDTYLRWIGALPLPFLSLILDNILFSVIQAITILDPHFSNGAR